jgi:hypothetical protein
MRSFGFAQDDKIWMVVVFVLKLPYLRAVLTKITSNPAPLGEFQYKYL